MKEGFYSRGCLDKTPSRTPLKFWVESIAGYADTHTHTHLADDASEHDDDRDVYSIMMWKMILIT